VDFVLDKLAKFLGNINFEKATENQMQVDDLFAKVSKEIEARKSWESALTPRYVYGGFITDDRQQMVEHLKTRL